MAHGATRSVFEPQSVPDDYLRRVEVRLVLRPKTFFANARDLALLRNFIAGQVPKINACALAATLPRAKLVFLKGVGHMPNHAAPEAVAAAIDELALARRSRTAAMV